MQRCDLGYPTSTVLLRLLQRGDKVVDWRYVSVRAVGSLLVTKCRIGHSAWHTSMLSILVPVDGIASGGLLRGCHVRTHEVADRPEATRGEHGGIK